MKMTIRIINMNIMAIGTVMNITDNTLGMKIQALPVSQEGEASGIATLVSGGAVALGERIDLEAEALMVGGRK